MIVVTCDLQEGKWTLRSSHLRHKIVKLTHKLDCVTPIQNSTFETDKSQCRQRFIYFYFTYLSRTMSKGAPERGIGLNVNKLRIPKQTWLYKNVVVCCAYGACVCAFSSFLFFIVQKAKKEAYMINLEISINLINCSSKSIRIVITCYTFSFVEAQCHKFFPDFCSRVDTLCLIINSSRWLITQSPVVGYLVHCQLLVQEQKGFHNSSLVFIYIFARSFIISDFYT